MERPPINRYPMRFYDILIAKHEFYNCNILVEGTSVHKHATKIVEFGHKIQASGRSMSEQLIMDKIIETLPPPWKTATDIILQQNKPSNSGVLIKLLEEAERDINPLWIQFEREEMDPNMCVRHHISKKKKIQGELYKNGFFPRTDILIYAIVNTLPPTWPLQTIQDKVTKETLTIDDLSDYLTDIEDDVICMEAFKIWEDQQIIQHTNNVSSSDSQVITRYGYT